jgi:hypothetical protein
MILVPGLERVVVMQDSTVVTVGDVLVTVYRAVQESAFEHHGDFATQRGVRRRRNFPAWGQADLMVNMYTPAIKELGEDHWWVGLHLCHNERDIWVLGTLKIDH